MKTESTHDPGSALREGERIFAHAWKLLALRGAIAIAFAFVLLVWPDIGLTAMVALVGAFALASGFMSGVAAAVLPGAVTQQRVWLAVNAILGLVVGATVLLWPDLSAKALLYAIAIWAIAAGVIELVAAFVLPLSGTRTVLVAVGGIVLAAFGVVMFVEPGDGAIALLALVAAFALVRGTFDVALAVELRRVLGELKKRMPSPVQPKPVAHG
jgi:uncharacterized membrane protein HdeD (DUF308 family)